MLSIHRNAIGGALLMAPLLCVCADLPQFRSNTLEASTVIPAQVPFNEPLLSRLKLPPGFAINVFAKGLHSPRMLAVTRDGTVYVTQGKAGTVSALRDVDGDGKADEVKLVAADLPFVNGIAIRRGFVYLAQPTVLSRAAIRSDGTLTRPVAVFNDLPDGGQHGNSRSMEFGPDGALYLQIGSTCNACVETNREHATLLRVDLSKRERAVYAEGLRNLIGFDWHPRTGELWGMDHGTDWRGDDQPPDELNRIVSGAHYGWPFCFGDRQPDVFFNQEPPGTTKEAYCPSTTGQVLGYQAHSAPLDFKFYKSRQFPQDYRHDAFVTMRGSWNRQPPTGYKVVRVKFDQGRPVGFEDFVTGFLLEDGKSQFGRPVGLAVARDGSLLFSDDANGVVYRVSYVGSDRQRNEAQETTEE